MAKYIKKADREAAFMEENPDSEFKEPAEKTVKTKKGKINFTLTEVKDKFNLLFEGLSKVAGREYIFSSSDFTQEAAGFMRICDKFPIVADIFGWFDPLLMVLGFFKKFRDMPVMQEKQKPGPAQQPQPEGLHVVGTQNINAYNQ